MSHCLQTGQTGSVRLCPGMHYKLQRLLAARNEAAARETALQEQAEAACAEAAAAAQLVHALRPPKGGDLTLGVLWNEASPSQYTCLLPFHT